MCLDVSCPKAGICRVKDGLNAEEVIELYV